VEYEVMYRLHVMRTFQRPFHCYFLRSKSGTFTRFRKFLIGRPKSTIRFQMLPLVKAKMHIRLHLGQAFRWEIVR
jgi:hypothetical protein